jgi:hypothetical protein
VVGDNLGYVPPFGTGGSLYIRPLLFGSGPRYTPPNLPSSMDSRPSALRFLDNVGLVPHIPAVLVLLVCLYGVWGRQLISCPRLTPACGRIGLSPCYAVLTSLVCLCLFYVFCVLGSV